VRNAAEREAAVRGVHERLVGLDEVGGVRDRAGAAREAEPERVPALLDPAARVRRVLAVPVLEERRQRGAERVPAEDAPEVALAAGRVLARLVLGSQADQPQREASRISGRFERRGADLLLRPGGRADETGRLRVERLVVRRAAVRRAHAAAERAAREAR